MRGSMSQALPASPEALRAASAVSPAKVFWATWFG